MINFNKKLITISAIFLCSLGATFYLPTKTFALNLGTGVESLTNTNAQTETNTQGTTSNSVLNGGTTNVGGNMNLPVQAVVPLTTINPAKNTASAQRNIVATKSVECDAGILNPLGAMRCFTLDLLSTISTAFISLSSDLLNNIIDGKMTGLGFSTTDNFVIEIGWGIVRNVANAALVIGLVWIAISIILGRENKAKETLINFIIIALLINFTPVICSFIIDGSNIITNSFMSGGVSDSYSTGITTAYGSIKTATNVDIVMQITYAVILLLFSLFFGVILLLYSLLFIARTIILWILVIVSPIAFATHAFPKFKHLGKIFPSILSWDEWWGSFWQWCVIGIPAGLSIYLANKILVAYSTSPASQISALSTFSPDNIFGFLFAYVLPFAFLLVGFFMSISTGTEAAQSLSSELTNWGRKGAGFIGNVAGGAAVGVAGAGAGGAAWLMKDQSRNDPSIPYVSAGEALKTGFGKGRDTFQKEGLIGTADRAVGTVAGAAIGAKNWMKRGPDSKAEASDYIEYGARKGFNDGGAGTAARIVGSTAGKAVGGIAGGAEGALTGALKAGLTGTSISQGAKEGIVEGAKEGARSVGTIAGSLGVKMAQTGVSAAGGVASTAYEKVVKVDEKGDKEKRDKEKAKKAAKKEMEEEKKWEPKAEEKKPEPPDATA